MHYCCRLWLGEKDTDVNSNSALDLSLYNFLSPVGHKGRTKGESRSREKSEWLRRELVVIGAPIETWGRDMPPKVI